MAAPKQDNFTISEDWTKEEYAEMHWQGIKEFIAELDESDWDDRSKLFQLVGYLEGYKQTDNELKHDYETR